MKKTTVGKIVAIMLALMWTLIAVVPIGVGYAYEMYPPYVLTFGISSATHTCALRIYNYGLGGEAANQFSYCTSKWNNVGGNTCVSSSATTIYSQANVRMVTPTTTWWENYWANNSYYYQSIIGQSQLYNMSGIYYDAHNAPVQNDTIRSNNVYMTPYETIAYYQSSVINTSNFSTAVLKALVHEIGHTLCLGHPPATVTANAIMRQGFESNAFFTTPQQLDITSVQTKYGS